MNKTYEPPDSYAPHLARLRAAAATPESRFAERYKAERLRALELEYAAAALRAAQEPEPRITAAPLAKYAPPNGYKIALDKLKETRR
jgi:hypothetical protein